MERLRTFSASAFSSSKKKSRTFSSTSKKSDRSSDEAAAARDEFKMSIGKVVLVGPPELAWEGKGRMLSLGDPAAPIFEVKKVDGELVSTFLQEPPKTFSRSPGMTSTFSQGPHSFPKPMYSQLFERGSSTNPNLSGIPPGPLAERRPLSPRVLSGATTFSAFMKAAAKKSQEFVLEEGIFEEPENIEKNRVSDPNKPLPPAPLVIKKRAVAQGPGRTEDPKPKCLTKQREELAARLAKTPVESLLRTPSEEREFRRAQTLDLLVTGKAREQPTAWNTRSHWTWPFARRDEEPSTRRSRRR
jgi:hypothetical protein